MGGGGDGDGVGGRVERVIGYAFSYYFGVGYGVCGIEGVLGFIYVHAPWIMFCRSRQCCASNSQTTMDWSVTS
jgi:hypothetical protein